MLEERFNARMFVDYHCAQRGIAAEDMGVAPTVVLSWGRGVIQVLAEATGAAPAEHWFYDRYPLYTSRVAGRLVSLAESPIGAPGTVAMMEELIACGARAFIGLGWAGSLLPAAPVGSLLIPGQCIPEEGTSLHYAIDGEAPAPDPGLAECLRAAAAAEGVPLTGGPQWTTDAPYRELLSKIRAYARRGVVGVDMETSAMYALGRFRGVRVCNLLVISDELWQAWRPAFCTPELHAADELARRVVLRCLAGSL